MKFHQKIMKIIIHFHSKITKNHECNIVPQKIMKDNENFKTRHAQVRHAARPRARLDPEVGRHAAPAGEGQHGLVRAPSRLWSEPDTPPNGSQQGYFVVRFVIESSECM